MRSITTEKPMAAKQSSNKTTKARGAAKPYRAELPKPNIGQVIRKGL